MKILLVTQYFWPENFRINDLVLALRERGHDLTVLTGLPNYPEGRVFSGYSFLGPREQSYYGARVFRVPIIPRGSGSAFRLVLNYVSFVISGALLGPLYARGKYDVVFVYEPSPVTVAIPALIIKRLKKVPMALWVLDLWPESVRDAGRVRSAVMLEVIRRLVRCIYKSSDLILAQSKAFVSKIAAEGVEQLRIKYFPSWAESLYESVGRNDNEGVKHPLPSGFRVLFAGNIGYAQGFDVLLAAAEKLRSYSDIHWLIVGDGRLREWVAREIVDRGLEGNVHLLGRHPMTEMPWFFSKADVLLVSLKKTEISSLTIPGKVQSYLASGKPVVAALDGEGAKVIEEAGAGISCPPGDPEALASAVLAMYRITEAERTRMGLAGRSYYERHFKRDMLIDRLVCWLEELTKRGSQGNQSANPPSQSHPDSEDNSQDLA